MKPFLKWAGNKYQILDHIKSSLPKGNRLIEPFVGSGAIFLNTDYSQNLLTDSNQDLINVYQHLQKEGMIFIEYCKTFFDAANNSKLVFYAFRDQFNATEDARLKSALFLYLNKHCFNGLCRYNNQGEFNTPFGKYKKPYFPEKEMLFFYQKAQDAEFRQSDFVATMEEAIRGDVVYCDPPYVPLSKTANFTSYSTGGFNADQQEQLANMAKKLAKKGVPVIISNHHTEFVLKIYKDAHIQKFDVQRYISCNGGHRGKAKEVLAVFT